MTFSQVLGLLGIVFALLAAVLVVVQFVQGQAPGAVALAAVAVALILSSGERVR